MSTPNTTAVPEALKAIKPYITLANQLEQKDEKVIAYYCRLYAVQLAMGINKSAPDCKKFLIQQMDTLEKIKSMNKGDESIASQIVGQAYVEKYALSIFNSADTDDRAAKFSKNLVKQFYTAGLLFDVLNYFGEFSEDLITKKDYAKKKAMYLNKCFQNNETPVPGPLLKPKDDADIFGGFQETHSFQPPQQPYPRYDMPVPSHSIAPSNNRNDDYTTETTPSSTINGEIILQAQKHCKFASNALQYEDVPTAIENLEKCLKLLKTGK